MTAIEKHCWFAVCEIDDLVPGSGVCVLVGEQQIALFFLPDEGEPVFALENYDPLGGAQVLSRGVVGDVAGELVVASPLYKQHFSLTSGRCLENDAASIVVYPVRIDGRRVMVAV